MSKDLRRVTTIFPFPTSRIVKGRVDYVVFYKGVKIYPTAINEVLMKYPAVKEYRLVFTKEPAKFEVLIETGKPSEELRKKITAISKL